MTRKASNLDAIEPEATASMSPIDIKKRNIKLGEMIEVLTKRGSITIRVREDRGIPEGVIFIPFCYKEAAANLLTTLLSVSGFIRQLFSINQQALYFLQVQLLFLL